MKDWNGSDRISTRIGLRGRLESKDYSALNKVFFVAGFINKGAEHEREAPITTAHREYSEVFDIMAGDVGQ